MGLSRSTRISILLAIDVVFFFVELIVGYAVGSLALVADSFHMLNDILSLIVALYAIRMSVRTNIDSRYSYGWHRAEILAALINGVFLLALCFSIFMEAMERFFSTPEISNPRLIVIVGTLGLASNIVGLFLFHEHSHEHGHSDATKERDHTDHEGLNETDSATYQSSEDFPDARGRSRSDSLYGHPAATRASLVQVAHDLQMNRSPSPSRRRNHSHSKHNTGFQPGMEDISEPQHDAVSDDDDNNLVTTATETTPLMAQAKHSSLHDAQRNSAGSGDSTPNVQLTKPKKNHAAGSMNMRALVLHVLGDALGNVGVIATGLVIWFSTFSFKYYFDPTISLVITAIIFSSALPLVRSASFILLQGVPSHVSLEEVNDAIHQVDGVQSVHELHIWQLSESKIVASVHVMTTRNHDFMEIASNIRKKLHDHGIHSSTIQPEYHPHSSRYPDSAQKMSSASCLITCPPGQQDCNPAEHACCPPPPAEV